MEDGGPELVEVDGLNAAVGVEMGESMAGEVGGEEEVSEVEEIEMRWIGGDEEGRSVFLWFVVGI